VATCRFPSKWPKINTKNQVGSGNRFQNWFPEARFSSAKIEFQLIAERDRVVDAVSYSEMSLVQALVYVGQGMGLGDRLDIVGYSSDMFGMMIRFVERILYQEDMANPFSDGDISPNLFHLLFHGVSRPFSFGCAEGAMSIGSGIAVGRASCRSATGTARAGPTSLLPMF